MMEFIRATLESKRKDRFIFRTPRWRVSVWRDELDEEMASYLDGTERGTEILLAVEEFYRRGAGRYTHFSARIKAIGDEAEEMLERRRMEERERRIKELEGAVEEYARKLQKMAEDGYHRLRHTVTASKLSKAVEELEKLTGSKPLNPNGFISELEIRAEIVHAKRVLDKYGPGERLRSDKWVQAARVLTSQGMGERIAELVEEDLKATEPKKNFHKLVERTYSILGDGATPLLARVLLHWARRGKVPNEDVTTILKKLKAEMTEKSLDQSGDADYYEKLYEELRGALIDALSRESSRLGFDSWPPRADVSKIFDLTGANSVKIYLIGEMSDLLGVEVAGAFPYPYNEPITMFLAPKILKDGSTEIEMERDFPWKIFIITPSGLLKTKRAMYITDVDPEVEADVTRRAKTQFISSIRRRLEKVRTFSPEFAMKVLREIEGSIKELSLYSELVAEELMEEVKSIKGSVRQELLSKLKIAAEAGAPRATFIEILELLNRSAARELEEYLRDRYFRRISLSDVLKLADDDLKLLIKLWLGTRGSQARRTDQNSDLDLGSISEEADLIVMWDVDTQGRVGFNKLEEESTIYIPDRGDEITITLVKGDISPVKVVREIDRRKKKNKGYKLIICKPLAKISPLQAAELHASGLGFVGPPFMEAAMKVYADPTERFPLHYQSTLEGSNPELLQAIKERRKKYLEEKWDQLERKRYLLNFEEYEKIAEFDCDAVEDALASAPKEEAEKALVEELSSQIRRFIASDPYSVRVSAMEGTKLAFLIPEVVRARINDLQSRCGAISLGGGFLLLPNLPREAKAFASSEDWGNAILSSLGLERPLIPPSKADTLISSLAELGITLRPYEGDWLPLLESILDEMTAKELSAIASELNIRGRSRMNRAELLQAVKRELLIGAEPYGGEQTQIQAGRVPS